MYTNILADFQKVCHSKKTTAFFLSLMNFYINLEFRYGFVINIYHVTASLNHEACFMLPVPAVDLIIQYVITSLLYVK